MSAINVSEVIGRTRARIRLQQPQRTLDDLGGGAPSWSDAGWTWAEVAARGGGSGAGYDGARSTVSYRLILRGPYDVRAGWRVLWGARVLAVEAVTQIEIARLALDCIEESL